MIILTNRQVQHESSTQNATSFSSDGNLFAEVMPEKNSEALFIAEANWNGSNLAEDYMKAEHWSTTFNGNATDEKLTNALAAAEHKKFLIYIHGFDQPFCRTLMKATRLEQEFGVTVILFSWPSHPPVPKTLIGRKATRYITNKSRRRARRAAPTLAKAFQIIGSAFKSLDAQSSLNMLVHSMGNLVLKKTIEYKQDCTAHCTIENIILHQAEVPALNHERWSDHLSAKQTFITINLNDFALKALYFVKTKRLGRSLKHLNSTKTHYVDFTHAQEVDNRHTIFLNSLDNPNIREFFQKNFSGEKWEFDQDSKITTLQ